jgi:thiol-disulfide isomerase/thioredoxin
MARFLGIVVLVAALALLGLFLWPVLNPEKVPNERPQTYSSSRSQAVAGDGTQPAPAPAPAAEAHPVSDAPAGPLCDQKFDAATARTLNLPAGTVVRKGPGNPGSWTWISVWAAWCKPCKVEMPILSAWGEKLRAAGPGVRVVFLSVDDDERQLKRFLAAEGAGLVGEVLWLQEESSRTAFYNAIKVENPPTLPVQALVDPQGKLRCVRVGSISDKELAEAAKEFGIR